MLKVALIASFYTSPLLLCCSYRGLPLGLLSINFLNLESLYWRWIQLHLGHQGVQKTPISKTHCLNLYMYMYIVQFIQAYGCPDINLKPISQSPSNSISLLLSSCLLAHFHAGWELTRPGCMPGRALKPYRAVLLWIILTEF